MPGQTIEPRRRRTSVATRLAVAVVAVCLVAVLVTSAVGLGSGRAQGTDLAESRLEAIRSARQDDVERLVAAQIRRVSEVATSPTTAESIVRFSEAYDALGPATTAQAAEVADWYREVLGPQLAGSEASRTSAASIVPTSPGAIVLQHAYTLNDAPGGPASVIDAGDGSQWSEVHAELHDVYEQVRQRYGLDDVYLIDASGRIVYSAAKAADLGTSLSVGPYSGSSFDQLLQRIAEQPEAGAGVSDFAPYVPAGNEPTAFSAAPVFDASGDLVGGVAFRASSEPLTAVMTSDAGWEADGLGATGESFLVAADRRVRSDLRPHVESPDDYLERAIEVGTLAESDATIVDATGTTVLVQEVDGAILEAAEAADRGFLTVTDPLGRTMSAAFVTLEVADLEWVLVTQISEAELTEGVDDYGRYLIRIVAVLLITVTLLAVVWAGWIVRPVRLISAALRGSDDDLSRLQGISDIGPTEFTDLAANFALMDQSLHLRHAQVEAATAERLELLRSLLPPAVAVRVEAGDRDVFDRIPEASVAVVVLEGLEALVTDTSIAEGRGRFESVVAGLDAAAERHGAERIKLLGDVVLVACGHSGPVLDHAPRLVEFARDAIDLVADGSSAGDADETHLTAAVAVHTGPVAVGLGGSNRLVYDVWGTTVSDAYVYGRAAPTGAVLVSAACFGRLPEELTVGAAPTTVGDAAAWKLTDTPSTEEPPSTEEGAT